jgi:hypothetical protein
MCNFVFSFSISMLQRLFLVFILFHVAAFVSDLLFYVLRSKRLGYMSFLLDLDLWLLLLLLAAMTVSYVINGCVFGFINIIS